MKNNFLKIFAIIICISVVFSAQINSLAAPVDTTAKANLTVTLSPDGKPISGAEFKLYRIADISRAGKVSLTPPFSGYPIIFKTQSAEELRVLALTLKGYVISEKIEPDYADTTDSNGQVSFKNIPLGMYLVVGSSIVVGDTVYIPEAFIVTLPAEAENETWEYNVNVRTKAIINNTNMKTNVRVLKVWDDDGDKSSRPDKIVVELYSGENLFDTVVLSKDNNWHYTWNDLSGNDWVVVEKEVPDGYKVSVERDENSFIITNSKSSDDNEDDDTAATTVPSYTTSPDSSDSTLTNPVTTKPDATDKDTTIPDEINSDTATDLPDEDVSGENPSENTGETDTGKNPAGDTSTDAENPSDDSGQKPTLPQTGMLWWPVPMLSLSGIILLMLGWRMNRRSEDEN